MQKDIGEIKMMQEIFDAIHSLILLKEEKDIEFFLRHRRQQVDKIEEAETTRSRYTVKFKNHGQPFYNFDYALRENGRLYFAILNFKEIGFGEIRKEFSQIYFEFIENPIYMVFTKKFPQGTLCFSVRGSDHTLVRPPLLPPGTLCESDCLTEDDYADIQNGILREEKLCHFPVDSVSMHYGQVFKGYQLEDDPSYEQG